MKHLKKIAPILLNIAFCILVLWFFTRNAFLRPYAGSFLKEVLAGLLLLGVLYANYFLFYPVLYQKRAHIIYWLVLFFTVLTTSIMELAIAYKNIALCNAFLIQEVGFIVYFSMHLFFIAGRNLLFNFFPFLFRERQHFQESLEKEVKVVYQTVRMLDVTDKNNNVILIPIDEIFYCHQQRNFTAIYTVQNTKYTRLGSMKHLEQLFGNDFVRITPSVLVPFRYIKKCTGEMVIMQKRQWEETPTTFQLESKTQEAVAGKIATVLQRYPDGESLKDTHPKQIRRKSKRKPVIPPQEKVKKVFSYINKHPNCNTTDVVAKTGFSLSTVERCIAELKQQGLIEHSGSKKQGGYYAVESGELRVET